MSQNDWGQRDLLPTWKLPHKKKKVESVVDEQNSTSTNALPCSSHRLLADVHHLHRAAQPLDVLGSHLHHLLDLAALLRPGGHTLDGHPFRQALIKSNSTVTKLKARHAAHRAIQKPRETAFSPYSISSLNASSYLHVKLLMFIYVLEKSREMCHFVWS